MIAIIDYGVGNLYSLRRSFAFIGAETVLTRDAETLRRADKLVLPGVGAFGDAADKLRETGLIPVLTEQAQAGKPLLGICLGMQLLFEESEEFGLHKGLGLLPGRIVPLERDLRAAGFSCKVPQIGWNALHLLRPELPLLQNVREGDCVYYVHSYYAVGCGGALAASSEYGVEVPGVVARENVCGCQFHPEKSGAAGLGILRAFAEVTE